MGKTCKYNKQAKQTRSDNVVSCKLKGTNCEHLQIRPFHSDVCHLGGQKEGAFKVITKTTPIPACTSAITRSQSWELRAESAIAAAALGERPCWPGRLTRSSALISWLADPYRLARHIQCSWLQTGKLVASYIF